MSRTFCQHFFVVVQARITKKPRYDTLYPWAPSQCEVNEVITPEEGIWGRPRDVVQGRTDDKPSKCFPNDPSNKQKWNTVHYWHDEDPAPERRKTWLRCNVMQSFVRSFGRWESEGSLLIKIVLLSVMQLIGRCWWELQMSNAVGPLCGSGPDSGSERALEGTGRDTGVCGQN